MGELCDTLLIDISLGKGVAGRRLFGQVLGGIRDICRRRSGRGGCCRVRTTKLLLRCRVIDGVQVLVDGPGPSR